MPGEDVLTPTGWLPTDAVLASLGEPTRWRVLWLLHDGDLAAGDIARQFEISRPAVSRHLAQLRAAGLVETTKRGQQVRYGLQHDVLGQLAAHLARLAGGTPVGAAFNDQARAAIERALADAAPEPIAYRVLRAVLADGVLGVNAMALPPGPGAAPEGPDDLPGEALQVLLAGAFAEARAAGHRRAGTAALALAALADESVRAALAAGGLDADDLAGRLRRHGSGPSDRLADLEASLSTALDAVRQLALLRESGPTEGQWRGVKPVGG